MLTLLPIPHNIQMQKGTITILPTAYIVMEPGAGMLMHTAATQLKDEIIAACGFSLMITCGKAHEYDILLSQSSGEAQGYKLDIAAQGITLFGHDDAGVLHGVQTLRQIIRQCGQCLPCVTIEDSPIYPVRGFYHDQTRGRIATLEYLKTLADDMCFYKMNQLQLYVEHTYLFRNIPELWTVAGTPLTSEDILELDDYCTARGIELVPSLSSFGHLLELLRLPRFASLCELENATEYPSTYPNRQIHHTIDPENEASFSLIASLIDEFMPLFRSNKFNICADETFDLGKGRNQSKDEKRLYMDFLKKLCAHVTKQGKIPMFWGDIILQFPDAVSELPKNSICLNWNYDASVTENATRAFAQSGVTQYLCPGVRGWRCFLPYMRASHENIRRMAEYGQKYGAAGLLNTDWGDYGHINDPRFSLPGMVAGACASWGNLPVADVLWGSLSQLAYGDKSGKILGLIDTISRCDVYEWRSFVRYKEWVNGRLELDSDDPVPSIEILPKETFEAANATLTASLEELAAFSLELPLQYRGIVAKWQVAADAILLWNRVGQAVANKTNNSCLAMELERWQRRYEEMWREVSQESELWRIREVTTWYADLLRR